MFTEDKSSGETPSREGFLKFLRSQEPDKRYEWRNSGACACAQYLQSIGQFHTNWLSSKIYADNNDTVGTPNPNVETMRYLNKIAGDCDGAYEASWTMGQCADRMKKVLEPA